MFTHTSRKILTSVTRWVLVLCLLADPLRAGAIPTLSSTSPVLPAAQSVSQFHQQAFIEPLVASFTYVGQKTADAWLRSSGGRLAKASERTEADLYPLMIDLYSVAAVIYALLPLTMFFNPEAGGGLFAIASLRWIGSPLAHTSAFTKKHGNAPLARALAEKLLPGIREELRKSSVANDQEMARKLNSTNWVIGWLRSLIQYLDLKKSARKPAAPAAGPAPVKGVDLRGIVLGVREADLKLATEERDRLLAQQATYRNMLSQAKADLDRIQKGFDTGREKDFRKAAGGLDPVAENLTDIKQKMAELKGALRQAQRRVADAERAKQTAERNYKRLTVEFNTFGAMLRAYRKYQEISNTQLALKTGFALSTLSNIENNKYPASHKVMVRLGEFLDFDGSAAYKKFNPNKKIPGEIVNEPAPPPATLADALLQALEGRKILRADTIQQLIARFQKSETAPAPAPAQKPRVSRSKLLPADTGVPVNAAAEVNRSDENQETHEEIPRIPADDSSSEAADLGADANRILDEVHHNQVPVPDGPVRAALVSAADAITKASIARQQTSMAQRKLKKLDNPEPFIQAVTAAAEAEPKKVRRFFDLGEADSNVLSAIDAALKSQTWADELQSRADHFIAIIKVLQTNYRADEEAVMRLRAVWTLLAEQGHSLDELQEKSDLPLGVINQFVQGESVGFTRHRDLYTGLQLIAQQSSKREPSGTLLRMELMTTFVLTLISWPLVVARLSHVQNLLPALLMLGALAVWMAGSFVMLFASKPRRNYEPFTRRAA